MQRLECIENIIQVQQEDQRMRKTEVTKTKQNLHNFFVLHITKVKFNSKDIHHQTYKGVDTVGLGYHLAGCTAKQPISFIRKLPLKLNLQAK